MQGVRELANAPGLWKWECPIDGCGSWNWNRDRGSFSGERWSRFDLSLHILWSHVIPWQRQRKRRRWWSR